MRCVLASLLILLLVCFATACRSEAEKGSVRPLSLRDVPAQRLAFSFKPDINGPTLPTADDPAKTANVQKDFETRRTEEALVRAVVSPDGQRVLALYETGDLQRGEFRIDMYAVEGNFLRNVTPPELACTFAPVVAWSPDGNSIAFIARKVLAPQPTPGLPDALPETPAPAPSVGPAFPPVPAFSTEQIYVCNRDGTDLHPLTTRDGLIYFHLVWSPDARALAALACKREEWDENEAARQAPAGRPRLITLDGTERLLDDGLKDALPVWSPDSSKIATAFDTDVWIYDAAAQTPTAARISLRDPLRAASAAFDAQHLSKNRKTDNAGGKTNESAGATTQPSAPPKSFAPIIRLEWAQPETLFIETGYIRIYPSAPDYPRWHELHLSPQATLISGFEPHKASDKSLSAAAVLN